MSSTPTSVEDDPSSIVSEELAKALSPFLKPGKEQQGLRLVTTMIQKVHRGPLPDPETLGGYEQILPGAAERVMRMAEREQGHRHRQESRMVSGEYLVRVLGQMGAMFAIGLLTSLAAFCAWLHEPIAAGAITAIGVAGAAFLRYSIQGQKRATVERQTLPQAAKKPGARSKQNR